MATDSPRAAEGSPDRPGHARHLARNTAFFSFATGLSRVLGLAREVVAARYFGVTGVMSAFTIAFQVPNLVRALFADSALQGAFVPVFTELLEKGERKEAFRVASSLFFLICLVCARAHRPLRPLRRAAHVPVRSRASTTTRRSRTSRSTSPG